MATAIDQLASRQREGQILVALAALAWSSAGVLQRRLDLDAVTQITGRAIFAGLALLAFVAVTERGHVVRATRSIGWAGVGFAVCLALASGSFIAALNHTSVARVLFIQAISPVLASLLAWVALKEPINARTALSLALALAGVALMLGAPGAGNLTGDLLALVMAVSFAVALVISRHRRDVSMAPATFISQLLLLVVLWPFASLGEVPRGDIPELAAMGAGQIGLGLALLTMGARLIPAAQVGLITLLEVVLGPFWVWLAYDERPETATLIGGAVVIVAIVVQTSGSTASGEEEAVPPP
ncbi:MAG TPA: DMT family transporter [Solirubrobacteraceae bacterium]|nr:DMT family transporter [Solirubrobacteraceae bacterium]